MNKNIVLFITIVIISSFKKVYCNDINSDYIYNSYEDLINDNYEIVLNNLEKIDQNYLSYEDLQNFIIEYIFVNYKLSNIEKVNLYINKFLSLYKDSKHTDYILYMKGLVNLKIDDYLLKKNFNYNYNTKSFKYITKSFLSFNELINNYPKSKYYMDSLNKIRYIKERLLIYNLSIINFYFNKSCYISVLNRCIEALKLFPEEPYINYIILYMKKSCKILSLNEIEQNIDLIIEKYPNIFDNININ